MEWELTRKPKCPEDTCPSANLSATNPTWPDLGIEPESALWEAVENRVSYGTAGVVTVVMVVEVVVW
jgi:hypothetical protein